MFSTNNYGVKGESQCRVSCSCRHEMMKCSLPWKLHLVRNLPCEVSFLPSEVGRKRMPFHDQVSLFVVSCDKKLACNESWWNNVCEHFHHHFVSLLNRQYRSHGPSSQIGQPPIMQHIPRGGTPTVNVVSYSCHDMYWMSWWYFSSYCSYTLRLS